MDTWLDEKHRKQFEINKVHIAKHISKKNKRRKNKLKKPLSINVKCSTCGNPLVRNRYRIKRYKYHFCDRVCHNMGHKKTISKNPVRKNKSKEYSFFKI